MLNLKIEAELKRLKNEIYNQIQPVEGWVGRRCKYLSEADYEFIDDRFSPIENNTVWGNEGITIFLENTIKLSPSFAGKTVFLQFKAGGEGCVFIDDIPYHGLDYNRDLVLLCENSKGDEILNIKVETYIPIRRNEYEEIDEPKITVSRLVCFNETIHSLFLDAQSAYECAMIQDGEYIKGVLLDAVYTSLSKINYENCNITDDAKIAKQHLNCEIEKLSGLKLPQKMVFTGHSHIDVAWKWPVKETVRKVSRTFSTALRLLERYDEFTFSQGSPQLYEYTKQYYPELYSQIKDRIKEGRWETVGGMWVEPDCNLISGESFVRQILYGKQYFKDEFGTDTEVCFLPDVFGFTGSLPQILKKTGYKYFFTSKLAWNDTNEFPYSVFNWQGIDGTKILSAVVGQGEDLYSGDITYPSIKEAMQLHKDKSGKTDIIYLYGHGDGGGGVTPQMLERYNRLKKLPMMPTAEMKTVSEYFDDLDKSLDYPIWQEELYFEKHRGTYTTQSRAKKYNRKCETLLQNAEKLSVFAKIKNKQYEKGSLRNSWKTLLLNQFHDILPGTSVTEVYERTHVEYEEILSTTNENLNKSISNITEQSNEYITVFNALSWQRSSIASFSSDTNDISIVDSNGQPMPLQSSNLKNGKYQIDFVAKDVPSLGYKTYSIVKSDAMQQKSENLDIIDSYEYENKYFSIVLNSEGNILSIYDKSRSMEIIKSGEKANFLHVVDDIPIDWFDAWEVNEKREDKPPYIPKTLSCEIQETGALYTRIHVTKQYSNSSIAQDIYLYHNAPVIEFKTKVNWNENQKMLRVSFPVNINSNKATYDIAFGTIERPAHKSTPYAAARFEVPAHKWGDLSEHDCGVSLLNDCKYGYSIHDGVMRLSLLRSPKYPDPTADIGEHEFTYALYPHQGSWQDSGVVQKAFELNNKLIATMGKCDKTEQSYFSIDKQNIMIDTVKNAEDGDDIIIRLYETYNQRTDSRLEFDCNTVEAYECDMLENNIEKLDISSNTINLVFKPYEIKTIRLKQK